MQDRTMVPANNLDETPVKPERCLRPPLVETKMEPYHDQQMTILSTLKPIASSYDHVGTRGPPQTQLSSILPIKVNPSILGTRKKIMRVMFAALSNELLDSNSHKNLRLEILKQSHDAINEFKLIVQGGQLFKKFFTSSSCLIGSFNKYNTSSLDEFLRESSNVMMMGPIGVSIRLAIMDAIKNLTNYLNKTVILKNFSCNLHQSPGLWRYPSITKFCAPALILSSQTCTQKYTMPCLST